MKAFYLLLLALAECAACSPQPVHFVPDADASYRASPAAPVPTPTSNGDACSAACANLRRVSCVEGMGAAGGLSCEDVCRSMVAAGLELHLGCLEDAGTREQVPLCCTGVGCSRVGCP